MTKKKSDINYLYIWKKLNDKLSDQEEKLLQNWRDESEENERSFQMFEYYHKNKKSILSKPVSVESAYANMQRLRKKRQYKNIFIKTSMVTAAAVLIGLIISITFFAPKKTIQKPTPISEVNILPGQKQAMLVLNDGSLHELHEEENVEIEEENALIKSSGKSIIYKTQKKRKNEILHNTLIVPRGAEFFITLSDGTKIWLNSETTLRYPVNFTEKTRDVELIGEAYFEVSKDVNHPFRVISNDHVIQILGTSFNLSSFKNKSEILTTLVEGRVVIQNTKDPKLSLELNPGQQSIFNKETGNAYQQEVDISVFTSWKDGQFKFKDTSLQEIMETFSRWYAIDVTFENELARRVKFSGVLKRHQNFEDIIPILESTNDLKIFAYENKIIVK